MESVKAVTKYTGHIMSPETLPANRQWVEKETEKLFHRVLTRVQDKNKYFWFLLPNSSYLHMTQEQLPHVIASYLVGVNNQGYDAYSFCDMVQGANSLKEAQEGIAQKIKENLHSVNHFYKLIFGELGIPTPEEEEMLTTKQAQWLLDDEKIKFSMERNSLNNRITSLEEDLKRIRKDPIYLATCELVALKSKKGVAERGILYFENLLGKVCNCTTKYKNESCKVHGKKIMPRYKKYSNLLDTEKSQLNLFNKDLEKVNSKLQTLLAEVENP